MGTGTLVHSLGSMNLSPMIFELYNAMFRNSDVYINIVKIMSEHHSGMTRSELSDAVGISYEDLSVSIVRDEEMLSRYIVLAEALEDYDKAA